MFCYRSVSIVDIHGNVRFSSCGLKKNFYFLYFWEKVLRSFTQYICRAKKLTIGFFRNFLQHKIWTINHRESFMTRKFSVVNSLLHAMCCTIWYHLHNLKNVKNTHGGVLILPATLLNLTLLHECFSRFLNCTNGTKSRNASQI